MQALSIALVLLVAAPALAAPLDDDPTDGGAESTAPADDARDETSPPTFHLRDGGRVAGSPRLEVITVETRYGVLRVPVDEVVHIRFSQRVDASVAREVETLVANLGDGDFDVREEAMDSIREIGPDALPALRIAVDSDDEEVKNRATILVEEIGEGADESSPEELVEVEAIQGEQDEIVTRRFTIRGRVLESEFQVESRYGALRLDASDLLGIYYDGDGEVRKSFDLDGTHIASGNWVRTRIELRKGQSLRVAAKGSLHVANYGVTATPDGSTRYRWNSLNSLALVGRIGKSGKPFLLGSSWSGKVPDSGELFLAVTPFRSYTATGKYAVKVEATR